jgi:PAS domain S-box-containing protein
MTAAELLRSVTRALSSGSGSVSASEDELPGVLVRGDEGSLVWVGGTLSVPVPGVGALLIETGPPDETLRAAADSVAAQIALFWSVRDMEARRRAMLDVAFDSVVTMDAGGIVLSANPAAERLFGYSAAEMVGQAVADLIVPPSLRDAHRRGLERYLRTGRGPVVGRRVELTAMRSDGTEFPVELVVTRPSPGSPPTAAPVFYGYLRDLTARYVAEASLHRLADEQAALRRVATAVAAEHDSARLFALVSEEVGRLLEAQTAHMFRFDSDGSGGAIIGGWGVRAEHVLAPGTRMTLDGDTGVAHGAGGADGLLRGRRGRAGGADARVRRAGGRRRAGLPRRVAVGRGRGLVDGPGAVPGGRGAAHRVLRGAGGAGARERAGAGGAGRVAGPHRRGG